MLTKDKAQEIFEKVRKFATADEVEVLIAGGKYALTRFANNTIHQNVAEENYICSIRTAFGKRTARATTNKFDDDSLRRAVADAEAISKVSITMLGGDSSGWQKFNSPDAAQVKPLELAEISARKAKKSALPKEIAPGKYTVILEPAAVLDLVGFMFFDFGGQSVLDERSFLMNRIGKKLFGGNITVYDDVRHPLQSGAPFDGEGVRRERVELITRGVPKNLVYARATAEKMKKSPLAGKAGEVRVTGHGFPLPNEMGEAPMNIVFAGPAAGEAKTVDEMVASTGHGVLVTRLWYIREVEPYEKMLTGMTRDGTFLIENGKLTAGLRNFRFNQSLIEMLLNVEAMSEPVRASGEESFDMVVPAMKVKDFNFTEVTKF